MLTQIKIIYFHDFVHLTKTMMSLSVISCQVQNVNYKTSKLSLFEKKKKNNLLFLILIWKVNSFQIIIQVKYT